MSRSGKVPEQNSEKYKIFSHKSGKLRDSNKKSMGSTGPQLEPESSTSLRNLFLFPRPIRAQKALAEVFDLCSRSSFPLEAKHLFLNRKFLRSRSFWWLRQLLAWLSAILKHTKQLNCYQNKSRETPKTHTLSANTLAANTKLTEIIIGHVPGIDETGHGMGGERPGGWPFSIFWIKNYIFQIFNFFELLIVIPNMAWAKNIILIFFAAITLTTTTRLRRAGKPVGVELGDGDGVGMGMELGEERRRHPQSDNDWL